ncbi:MAG: phosphopantetheine-binding protein [Polyangiales bacterium]
MQSPDPRETQGRSRRYMALEDELKELIVEALMLDDVAPANIETDAPLFGDGLGLDSVDALELSMAVEQKWGVRLRAEDANVRNVMGSVKTLAAHIAEHRTK